jgi:ABC-type antimicrobial peptide transport system permease subunit
LVEYLFHIDVSTYFIAFALTFLVSLSINIILSLRNRKVKMIEALKSVE